MTKNQWRWLFVFLVGALIAFWHFTNAGHFLDLAYLKSRHADLVLFVNNNPWRSALVYVAVYVVVTALSFPGAAILTLFGGAAFGLWWGTLLVSFASSIGATLAFLSARFVAHDAVMKRFSSQLTAFNRGIEHDGVWYLVTLRLAPVVPFFLINIVMGLTAMPVWQFYWVSQLGMLPGTWVYVNAGTQLGSINSMSDVMSPPVFISLFLLAAFPWLVRKLLGKWSKRLEATKDYRAG